MEYYFGIVVAASTYGFLLLGEYCMTFELIPKWFLHKGEVTIWGYIWYSLFQIFFLLAIISHLKASFMEPGYTPKFPVPGDIPIEKIRYCEKCNQWKPDRTHHCRACKKCIHRMDHHCPWINNCVGAKNQKFFSCFLLYVFLCCFEVISIMIYVVVVYFSFQNRNFKNGLVSLLISVFTGVIASVFLVFTLVMFYDQIDVIINNQTEVEKLSDMIGADKTSMENLKASLGESVINWFNPFVDSPNPDYSEVLYSYKNKTKKE